MTDAGEVFACTLVKVDLLTSSWSTFSACLSGPWPIPFSKPASLGDIAVLPGWADSLRACCNAEGHHGSAVTKWLGEKNKVCRTSALLALV